ncbi:MAG: N-acetylglucosamine-6-phosphate deacetylase [Firmicutes bacterium]|nr:N-acetylglucosamine-6-phosphate deacetylase [Bacillota bacterium]
MTEINLEFNGDGYRGDDYFLLNGRVITPYRIIEHGGIRVQGQYITRVFDMANSNVPEGSRVIDVRGVIIAPGFIDIHLHGGGGADVMDGSIEAFEIIARTHAQGGATAILPSTLTSSLEDLHRAISAFERARDSVINGARLLGLHLEGPYFAEAQCGAQDPRYLREPAPEEYLAILDKSAHIMRVSAAPELPGALELGRELRRRHILASIGHSDATYDDVLAAIESGYSHVTHLYSGMSGVKRVNCYRVTGVIESALLLDELTVEVIADGKHLPASLLKLIYKCKGPERVALCTDAIRAASMPDGEYIVGSEDDGRRIIVDDGVAWLEDRSAFAGSVATIGQLVRNMVNMADVSLRDAIKMATSTPAKILGVDDKMGCLDPGKNADMVVLDSGLSVIMTIVGGRVVYRAPGLD